MQTTESPLPRSTTGKCFVATTRSRYGHCACELKLGYGLLLLAAHRRIRRLLPEAHERGDQRISEWTNDRESGRDSQICRAAPSRSCDYWSAQVLKKRTREDIWVVLTDLGAVTDGSSSSSSSSNTLLQSHYRIYVEDYGQNMSQEIQQYLRRALIRDQSAALRSEKYQRKLNFECVACGIHASSTSESKEDQLLPARGDGS